ncbi:MAG TPA: hypothetical protein VKY27_00825 [Bacteriovoracaceae bacterium]|nr:hypothetical protein [Bacteriovoracaceae bacterium]
MSGLKLGLTMALLLSSIAHASNMDLKGFNDRFKLVRNHEGKLETIKLKIITTKFSVEPFLKQIKADLYREQESFNSFSRSEKEAQIDDFLYELGFDPYTKSTEGAEEAQAIKDSLLSIGTADIEGTFAEVMTRNKSFWSEFERKLNEAWTFVDPAVMCNLNDARFFYKRQATYKVVTWALEQAQKRFATIPALNIATYVIHKIHDMMNEQRAFHHNMLLHYFETIPETQLGMTKAEVDLAISSIYEYRIGLTNIFESNRAAENWNKYGINKFYAQVRSGNNRLATGFPKQATQKLNYAFANVNGDKIYHLHHNLHSFSKKPSLAFDYSSPTKIRNQRAIMNLAGVALGFIPLPGWIKSNVDGFIQSFYREQVRTEGALVGYFESQNNPSMVDRIYAQRANFYIRRN